jgi:hypothetical protein
MITQENLPNNYKPYDKLIVCSNRLNGAGYLVRIGKALPVLLGQGDKPMVWLQAPVDPAATSFTTIVEASLSKTPSVRIFEDEGALIVSVGGTVILKVRNDGTSAIVDELDLRPIGIRLWGDSKKLTAAGVTISDSSFGSGTLVAFGN